MAAESGYAAAQFNVAYLCEQNTVSYWHVPPKNVSLLAFIVTAVFLFIQSFWRNCRHSVCQQGRFLDSAFASWCEWRYYNLTIQSQNPDTYGKSPAFKTYMLADLWTKYAVRYLSSNSPSPALIRMGDLLYERQVDRQKDLFSAAEMYKLAALRNKPQVCFI